MTVASARRRGVSATQRRRLLVVVQRGGVVERGQGCRSMQAMRASQRRGPDADAPVPEQFVLVRGGPPLPLGLTAEVMVVASAKQPEGKCVGGRAAGTDERRDRLRGRQRSSGQELVCERTRILHVRRRAGPGRAAPVASVPGEVRLLRSLGARPPRGARGRGARLEPCEAHGFQRLGAYPCDGFEVRGERLCLSWSLACARTGGYPRPLEYVDLAHEPRISPGLAVNRLQ